MNDTETVTVTVDVTNTGAFAGKECVQLYVTDKESTLIRPRKELKGFEKIELAPGETKTVTFVLGKRHLLIGAQSCMTGMWKAENLVRKWMLPVCRSKFTV